MTSAHYLSEAHLLLFLVQMFVLLAAAKLLGSLFSRRGFPALAGEILTGILFGPTVFGRVFPAGFDALFPNDLVQQNMLETVSFLGVLLLLLAIGFEVTLSSVWKQGKAVVTIGTVGVVVPFVIGLAVFWWIPAEFRGPAANRLTFTLFLSTAASISAIAVIAKVLHDLEILKSDFGLTTLSSFVINDILGWLVFSIVLGVGLGSGDGAHETARVFFEIVLFGIVCLTVGSRLVGAITKSLKRTSLPQPETTLSLIVCLAMLCGAITQWIGIHAILGFFLAGIMAGNTAEISERTREIISQMVHSLFVPVFFAYIGIKIDFLNNLDILLVVIFTTVAIGGKFLGAWIGGSMAKLSPEDALSMGIAFIPGGAMEIVISMLALELGIISESVFVPIVFAALSSSIIVGPLLGWSIKRRRQANVADFLSIGSIISDLKGRDKWEVIRELCGVAANAAGGGIDSDSVCSNVISRERLMGTGLEKGIAIPHCRLTGLESPVIAFGKSGAGIDWDARDGLATHFVFMVLTPEHEEGAQVQILAAIARCMVQQDISDRLMGADDSQGMFRILKTALQGVQL